MRILKCSRCHKSKSEINFYKDGLRRKRGRSPNCKDCDRIEARERYVRNAGKYRKRAIAYYAKHRAKKLQYSREYHRLNKMKKSAGQKVKNALYKGLIIRQPCEVCGNLRVEAHHDDYSKPLSIRWLCPTHHHRHHWSGYKTPEM